MTKRSVTDDLRTLAMGSNRSDTAKLRDIFEDVQAALDAGVSHAAVVETLSRHGIAMSLNSFRSAMSRIRKERSRKDAGQTPRATVAADETRPEDSENKELSADQSAGLTSKQRRERLANEFIKPQTTNPLIKRFMEKEQKK